MDSAATHNMVQKIGNLDNPTLFRGSDSIILGDGKDSKLNMSKITR